VTYELQPPGLTTLKGLTIPELGGDTLFAHGAALYSSLSTHYQKYLEGLQAVHSGVEQANGAKGAGQFVRREPIQTVHPVVRVHPVTGIKSVFVNPGFTRRILGVPRSESENTLRFLYSEFATNPDINFRFKWQKDDVALWDNRVVNHSAMFDFWPERRHALRVTPHGEKPLSVAEYEDKFGKQAKDWATVRYQALGLEPLRLDDRVVKPERGFKD
jgi:sulfonate dioxygenase